MLITIKSLKSSNHNQVLQIIFQFNLKNDEERTTRVVKHRLCSNWDTMSTTSKTKNLQHNNDLNKMA